MLGIARVFMSCRWHREVSNSALIMTKVVHLTSAHPATDTRILHRECASLARMGYETVLIAPAEGDEVREGVQIRAIARPHVRWRRMLGATSQVYRKALAEQADVYHFHDPELIPVGLLLKRAGKRVIYDVHEYYSEILSLGFPTWLQGTARVFLHRALEFGPSRWFDHLVFPTESLRDEYASAANATALYNYPSLANGIPEPLPELEKRYDVVFMGAVSPFRMAVMLEVAQRLAKPRPALRWLFLGIPQATIDWVVEHYDKGFLEAHVVMKTRVPFEQVLQHLAASRVGYNYHPMQRRFRIAIPMKVYEYMLAGLPVVTSAFPELARVLVSGQDVIFPASDAPADHAEALADLLDRPEEAARLGRAGHDAILERLNWEASEVPKLKALYARVLAS